MLRRTFGHTRGEVTRDWRRIHNEETKKSALFTSY
jgi:hypothetical protein